MNSYNANVINKVAGGESIQCKECGTVNASGSKFCMTCGSVLQDNAFADAAPDNNKSAFETAATEEKKAVYVEPSSAFAEGLPEWSIVPPQVVVRRK